MPTQDYGEFTDLVPKAKAPADAGDGSSAYGEFSDLVPKARRSSSGASASAPPIVTPPAPQATPERYWALHMQKAQGTPGEWSPELEKEYLGLKARFGTYSPERTEIFNNVQQSIAEQRQSDYHRLASLKSQGKSLTADQKAQLASLTKQLGIQPVAAPVIPPYQKQTPQQVQQRVAAANKAAAPGSAQNVKGAMVEFEQGVKDRAAQRQQQEDPRYAEPSPSPLKMAADILGFVAGAPAAARSGISDALSSTINHEPISPEVKNSDANKLMNVGAETASFAIPGYAGVVGGAGLGQLALNLLDNTGETAKQFVKSINFVENDPSLTWADRVERGANLAMTLYAAAHGVKAGKLAWDDKQIVKGLVDDGMSEGLARASAAKARNDLGPVENLSRSKVKDQIGQNLEGIKTAIAEVTKPKGTVTAVAPATPKAPGEPAGSSPYGEFSDLVPKTLLRPATSEPAFQPALPKGLEPVERPGGAVPVPKGKPKVEPAPAVAPVPTVEPTVKQDLAVQEPVTPEVSPTQPNANSEPVPAHYQTGLAVWDSPHGPVPVTVTDYVGKHRGAHLVDVEGATHPIPLSQIRYPEGEPNAISQQISATFDGDVRTRPSEGNEGQVPVEAGSGGVRENETQGVAGKGQTQENVSRPQNIDLSALESRVTAMEKAKYDKEAAKLRTLDPHDERIADPYSDEYLPSVAEAAYREMTGKEPPLDDYGFLTDAATKELVNALSDEKARGLKGETAGKKELYDEFGGELSDLNLKSDKNGYVRWTRRKDGVWQPNNAPNSRVGFINADELSPQLKSSLDNYIKDGYSDPEYVILSPEDHANAKVNTKGLTGLNEKVAKIVNRRDTAPKGAMRLSEAAMKDAGSKAQKYPVPLIKDYIRDNGIPLKDPGALAESAAKLNLNEHELQDAIEYFAKSAGDGRPAESGRPNADNPASGASRSGVGSEEKSPVTAPRSTLEATKTDVPKRVGISNRMQAEQVAQGDITLPEKGARPSKEAIHEQGKGTTIGDATRLADEVANGHAAFNSSNVAKLKEGGRLHQLEVNAAREALDSAIKTGEKKLIESRQQAYDKAKEAHQKYVDDVQKGKTEWSNTGRALQDALELNTGDFAQVAAEWRRQKGRDLTPEEETRIKDLTDRVNTLEKNLAEAEANRILRSVDRQQKAANRGTAKSALKAEREDIFKQLASLSTKVSANPIPETIEGIKLVGKLAVNVIKDGALTLEEVVDRVNQHLAEAGFEKLKDRQIYDALSGYGQEGKARTQSEAVKQISELKKVARLVSQINDAIAGEYHPGKSPGKAVGLVADLRSSLNEVLKAQDLRKAPESDPVKRMTKAIADALDILENGKPEKKPPVPDTPVVAKMRADLEGIRKKIAEKYGDPSRAPKSEQDRLAVLEKGLKSKEDQLANQHRPVRQRANSTAAIDEVKAKIKEVTRKINVTDQIHELERQLRENDSPDKKTREPESAEVERLKRERDLAKAKVLDAIEAARPKTFGERFAQFQQASILSSPAVFGKLAAATAGHSIISPFEEAIGSAIGLLADKVAPNFRKMAGTELRGSLKAEASAIGDFFKADTYKDAYQKLLHGHNSLGAKAFAEGVEHGAENKGNPIVRLIRNSHGAVKTPLQRAAFQREWVKQLEHFDRQGRPLDAAARADAFAAAYEASQRAILMNDSAAARLIRQAINLPKRLKGPGGDLTAAGLKTLMPIVRVPVNFAGRAAEYQFGIPYALVKAVIHRNNMTPEAAGAIARALKRGSVGGALMIIGSQLPDTVKVNKNGDVEVDGEKIPAWATHVPILNALKMGLTFRDLKSNDELTGADKVQQVANQGLVDTVSHTPVLSAAKDIVFGMASAKSVPKAAGRYAVGVGIPQPLQQFARGHDDAEDREATGFWDTIGKSIPYVRETLPEKSKKE